jgi:hypothetical protein
MSHFGAASFARNESFHFSLGRFCVFEMLCMAAFRGIRAAAAAGLSDMASGQFSDRQLRSY